MAEVYVSTTLLIVIGWVVKLNNSPQAGLFWLSKRFMERMPRYKPRWSIGSQGGLSLYRRTGTVMVALILALVGWF
jgi:hypothetical protein